MGRTGVTAILAFVVLVLSESSPSQYNVEKTKINRNENGQTSIHVSDSLKHEKNNSIDGVNLRRTDQGKKDENIANKLANSCERIKSDRYYKKNRGKMVKFHKNEIRPDNFEHQTVLKTFTGEKKKLKYYYNYRKARFREKYRFSHKLLKKSPRDSNSKADLKTKRTNDNKKTRGNKKSDENRHENDDTADSKGNKKMTGIKFKDETRVRQNEKDNSGHKTKNKEIKKLKPSNLLDKKELKSLRDALLVSPLDVWKFKDRFNSMADLGIHETLLHDVVENKWNRRLKHKLFKVFKGEDIHVAVIGGSNTAGGGIQQDEGTTQGIFFRVILDWWQKIITPITGSHLKTRQIAMGGTGSDFFQYCHRSYVQKNVDLVLLEMSVNDLHELPYNVNLSLPIEQLTRQLLEYPTEPALLYINLLSGRSYYQGCTNLEDFGQRLLSDVYKITTFSWRDAVCPVVDGKYRIPLETCKVVCKDGHHINQLGHAHISLMAINLFRDLLLDNIGHVDELSAQMFHDEVLLPRPVFIRKMSKIITEPVCWTTVTPNFRRKIITNSMEVGIMENYGFDYLHNKPIGGKNCWTEKECRADAYSGWTGQDAGAILMMSFTVPSLGHKRHIRSRSVIAATRTCWKCGAAEIWLDDDIMSRRQVVAHSPYSQTLLEIIARRVEPGDHTMNVKLIHPGFFTVVGVMLGPPDGPY